MMKGDTCAGCAFYIATDDKSGIASCHSEPPKVFLLPTAPNVSNPKGGLILQSVRPTVGAADQACMSYMPLNQAS